MNSNRDIVRVVGVLFLLQMAAAVLSYSVILDPILYKPNFLNELAANSTMVTMAMLFDLICGASVFAIAVLLFPILKHHSERVALWYVGGRLTELVSLMISGVLLLTLLTIGQEVAGASVAEVSQSETTAQYLRHARGNVQDISLLVYCLSSWAFYGLLYYSKLVPRFISGWGVLGVTLLFAQILANVFDKSIASIMIIGMPLGLNEVFLGVWLIVKGMNRTQMSHP